MGMSWECHGDVMGMSWGCHGNVIRDVSTRKKVSRAKICARSCLA